MSPASVLSDAILRRNVIASPYRSAVDFVLDLILTSRVEVELRPQLENWHERKLATL